MSRDICRFCNQFIHPSDPHYQMGIGHEACELTAARAARMDYLENKAADCIREAWAQK